MPVGSLRQGTCQSVVHLVGKGIWQTRVISPAHAIPSRVHRDDQVANEGIVSMYAIAGELKKTDKQTDRQAGRQVTRWAGRQGSRQADRQEDKSNIHTCLLTSILA